MSTNQETPALASVDLYWLPLGAGDALPVVRWNGRIFEALVAAHEHRPRYDLYHSALEVKVDGRRFVIEMAPVWGNKKTDRGVVCEGAVGLSGLGRSRFFRYEVRRWCGGVIPDVAEAVESPRRLSGDAGLAERILSLVPGFPTAVWGRDELRTGEMWNSNSLISWLLARSGHDIEGLATPAHGRAPGWSAGLVVAAREASTEAPQCGPLTIG